MRKEKSCGAVIYRDKGSTRQILLIRHKNSIYWTFPKGHMERGENEHQTALREIKEETGLDVVFLNGFRESLQYNPKPNVDKEVVYFLAKSKTSENVHSDVIISNDVVIDEAKWVDIEKVPQILSFQNYRSLFLKAQYFMKEQAV